MNKLKLIGVSALCGSLAAVSAAQAGEMAVTGSANATWLKKSWGVTGNPLGQNTALSFAGSGELDNGNAFTVSIDLNDKAAWSNSALSVDIGGMGTLTLDGGGGTGLDRLDDKTPNAYEEAYDTSLDSGIVTVAGAGGSTDIEWTVSPDMLPDGLSAWISYTPRAGAGLSTDKSSAGSVSEAKGSGWDIALESTAMTDGLTLFGGYSSIEQTAANHSGDHTAYTVGANYAVGSFTVGYQFSRDNVNINDGTQYYENDGYGVTFNVNDDLSLSYGKYDSSSNRDVAGGNATLEATSIQMSYTMGGATLAIAESSVDNGAYLTTTAQDRETTLISLTLAF